MDVEESDLLVVDSEVVVSAAVVTPTRRVNARDDHLMVKGVVGMSGEKGKIVVEGCGIRKRVFFLSGRAAMDNVIFSSLPGRQHQSPASCDKH